MKTNALKIVLAIFFLGIISCQKEDDHYLPEESVTEKSEMDSNSQKSNTPVRIVCSIEGIPPGYIVEEYLTMPRCPNVNLFLGRFNAAIVSQDGTPKIFRAGAGDNYCIWIVGDNFESNAYVDIRSPHGSNIIGTYRGADRHQYVNSQGQDVITLRLRTQTERNLFANGGLRIWVVNPVARKWADGRTVRRPGGVIIDPDCNPICP
ncbi:hypothetical protein AB832_01525 [Flavobacteriaceae bacterium (ex Bugula neritina AB1)]|nr:hypothetical protein AB832_01525 [Flavobacteriaceae bacterium (ex Bugula neritina AB1)]